MSGTSSLRTLLLAAAGVTGLVGNRVRATSADETAVRPFIVITRTDTERDIGLDGSVGGTKEILQVECVADTRLQAEAVSQAVTDACIADQRFVTGPVAADVVERGIEIDVLTVDWWDD
jgi:hypothetical protein